MQNSRIPESELILNSDGSVYHLHLRNEHIADRVILVGDPGRVDQVAQFFRTIDFQANNREFKTVTGSYMGTRFTVLSSGIGTDNIDIVVNELDAAVNIDPQSRLPRDLKRSLNLVRIGTSGALQGGIEVDSFVVSSFALGLDGLLYYYDFQLTDNEIDISKKLNQHLNWDSNLARPYVIAADQMLLDKLGHDMHQGITATATGFYGPQGRELTVKLKNQHMHDRFRSFEHHGWRITNFEMESSALYALGRMLGHRCCTCCAIIANRVTKEYSQDYKPVIDDLIKTVLDRLI
jgi:uridine phosphorylase